MDPETALAIERWLCACVCVRERAIEEPTNPRCSVVLCMSDTDDDFGDGGGSLFGEPLLSASGANGAPALSESAPPSVVGQEVTADALGQTHPLWQRAAGHKPVLLGAGGGRSAWSAGRGAATTTPSHRYEPLSALALELEGFRHNADGASSLFSESERGGFEPYCRAVPPAHAKGLDGSCMDVPDEEANDKRDVTDPMFASAAFGGGYAHRPASAGGTSVDSASTSKLRKRAHRAAFPLKGIQCVGCTLVTQIAPVERFVREHMDRMAEEALWKFAVLTYVNEVRAPREREGVATPEWHWKDVRTHFLLHSSDTHIARQQTCRQLQTMRYALEQRLMRVENGEKELDKTGCELMLKIVRAESEQRSLLSHPSKAGNRMVGINGVAAFGSDAR